MSENDNITNGTYTIFTMSNNASRFKSGSKEKEDPVLITEIRIYVEGNYGIKTVKNGCPYCADYNPTRKLSNVTEHVRLCEKKRENKLSPVKYIVETALDHALEELVKNGKNDEITQKVFDEIHSKISSRMDTVSHFFQYFDIMTPTENLINLDSSHNINQINNLDIAKLNEIYDSPLTVIYNTIMKIHFDPNKPKYHNIRYNSLFREIQYYESVWINISCEKFMTELCNSYLKQLKIKFEQLCQDNILTDEKIIHNFRANWITWNISKIEEMDKHDRKYMLNALDKSIKKGPHVADFLIQRHETKEYREKDIRNGLIQLDKPAEIIATEIESSKSVAEKHVADLGSLKMNGEMFVREEETELINDETKTNNSDINDENKSDIVIELTDKNKPDSIIELTDEIYEPNGEQIKIIDDNLPSEKTNSKEENNNSCVEIKLISQGAKNNILRFNVEQIKHVLTESKGSILDLFKRIHFDINKPQYNNIRFRENKIECYKNEEWITMQGSLKLNFRTLAKAYFDVLKIKRKELFKGKKPHSEILSNLEAVECMYPDQLQCLVNNFMQLTPQELE